MRQEYHLIDDPSVIKYPSKFSLKSKRAVVGATLILSVLGISLYPLYSGNTGHFPLLNVMDVVDRPLDKKFNKEIDHDLGLIYIRGEPRVDKYGIDLNINLLDGIYTVGMKDNPDIAVEDLELYTPPCPYLRPIHHPDSVIHPVCEGSSLQVTNFDQEKGAGLPYSLRLDSITHQMEKWEEWKKTNGTNPMYGERTVQELVRGEEYYPFDYGYHGGDTQLEMDDHEYYSRVIQSRMDEVPDPRRRRLFSFIMFNGEYDLLDLYLAEYYEIIDYFVIYESNTTFSGNAKPLYFTRTLFETDRYDQFKDKLIPLPCETIVDEDNGRGKGFPKEHVARRILIEKGLRAVHARHGDIFMHGDLDEMPKIHTLSRIKKCGGWEHLQAGIGGGPKSFKDPETKSYFIDHSMNVTLNENGEYQVDYERRLTLGFLAWFYEYSFNIIQNPDVGTFPHPNIAIFDARRSLGQLVEYDNRSPGFHFNTTEPKVVVKVKTRARTKKVRIKYKTKTISGSKAKSRSKNSKSKNSKSKRFEKEDEMYENVIENENHLMKREEFYDPLLDPNFDPYQGYTYTDNTNDKKLGQGYLGEYGRFLTHEVRKAAQDQNALLWNGSWHLSSFLPTIDHFYNKISSYSHFNVYENQSRSEIEADIIERVKSHSYIYGSTKKYPENRIYFPPSYEEGYDYNFNYTYWKENMEALSESFLKYLEQMKHEIPTQVYRNPICYSFMMDRDYGLDKKLWWQVIPKSEWKTVHFEELDPLLLNELLPENYPESLKESMIKNLGTSN